MDGAARPAALAGPAAREPGAERGAPEEADAEDAGGGDGRPRSRRGGAAPVGALDGLR